MLLLPASQSEGCSDAAPPVHCTVLQQPLHAQHVTPSSECAWPLIYMSGVCVAPHLSSTGAHWELQSTLFVWKPHSSITFCDSCHWNSQRCSLDSIANKTLKCFNEFCIISNQLFPFPHFPQKRAKKLQGETIYIRHSNLMLEVCIFRYLFWLLAVTFLCLHVCCVDILFALTPLFLFSEMPA